MAVVSFVVNLLITNLKLKTLTHSNTGSTNTIHAIGLTDEVTVNRSGVVFF